MQFKKLSISNIFPSKKSDKVEQNDDKSKLRLVRPSQFLNCLDILPALNEKEAQQQKQEIHQRRSVLKEQQKYFLPSIAIPKQENLSPKKSNAQSVKQMRLIPFPIEEEKQENQRIKRSVCFRNSIRIIDYTNDIISRDSINGEQKPLKRIRHRKTKTKTEAENDY